MGFDVNGVKALLHARAAGVDFSKTAMIGRQYLDVRPEQFKTILDMVRVPYSEPAIKAIMYGNNHYSEGLLRALGAAELVSLDCSDYEGANIVHDMNRPIPDELRNRFSLVIDGGSLEHVFNFPVAIENCMRMVAPGGHFLALTPANNFMGHGFYQFSPELFFSLLNPHNGFDLETMIAYEDRPNARWFRVANPADRGCRVTLINRRPVFLLVLARRKSGEAVSHVIPSQSDYVPVWAGRKPATLPRPAKGILVSFTLKYIPGEVKEGVKRLLARWKARHTFNRRFFTPFHWVENCNGIERILRF